MNQSNYRYVLVVSSCGSEGSGGLPTGNERGESFQKTAIATAVVAGAVKPLNFLMSKLDGDGDSIREGEDTSTRETWQCLDRYRVVPAS